MRTLLLFSLLLFIFKGYGQYYFNDIVSTQESNERFRLLRLNKVKKIMATGYEADNSKTEGFHLAEEISLDGKKSQFSNQLTGGKESTSKKTYELNKIKRNQSFSNKIETRTDYTYNEKTQLQKIQFTTSDTSQQSNSVEWHEWIYTETGQLQSMLRIKNKTDTSFIEFVTDDKDQVIEERWKKKGKIFETYYYYYNANKKLTDIVRYNQQLKKLIPDFLFEYDANGRINQMTQISLMSSNYFIWKYEYNDKGLKQKEIGFDKERKVIGRIEYTYELF